MVAHALGGLIVGVFNALVHAWWIVALVLGVKLGPRFGRGLLIRRGGLR